MKTLLNDDSVAKVSMTGGGRASLKLLSTESSQTLGEEEKNVLELGFDFPDEDTTSYALANMEKWLASQETVQNAMEFTRLEI